MQGDYSLLDRYWNQLEMPHYIENVTGLQKPVFQLLLENEAITCLFDSLLMHFLLINLLQKEQDSVF